MVRAGQVFEHLPGSPLLYYNEPMTSRIVLQRKKQSPARRAEYDPITSLRMPPALKSKVKDWAKEQDEKLSISKAICRLVERGLAAEVSTPKGKRSNSR